MAEGGYTYAYPRPAVTVDAVVFAVREGRLEVALIRRGRAPFEGAWALPGGFIEMDEELEAAAVRELIEETGLDGVRLEQFHAFGGVHRDPRGRTIAVAHVGIAGKPDLALRANDDAAEAGWFPVSALPPLAFDHDAIIDHALRHLRRCADARALACLPESVRLEDLEAALRQEGY